MNSQDSSDGLTAAKVAKITSEALSELARRGRQSGFLTPQNLPAGTGGNLVKAAAVVAPAAVAKTAAAVAAAPVLAPLAAAAAVGGGVYGTIKLVKWLKD